MTASTRWYDAEQLRRISELTIAHYDRSADAYWEGTRDHDVNQNYAALLDAIEGDPPYSILDLGCGPGRDLRYFQSLGHDAVGLDGSTEFVAAANSQPSADRFFQAVHGSGRPCCGGAGVHLGGSRPCQRQEQVDDCESDQNRPAFRLAR